MIKKYYREILIFSGFIILTLVTTYPVIFRMNTSVYGPLYGTDNRGAIWHFWWLKYAWLHNMPSDFISIIASPFGIDYSHPLCPLWLFLSKWLSIWTNEIFTYNFFLLLSFPLSAITMYYLVHYLTRDKLVSVVSGMIYAFCPYHFNRAWEHFSLAQTEWIVLYALTLLILRKKPIFKNAIFAALAFTLVMNFDINYAYIMSIFTLGFLIFVFVYKWRDRLRIANRESQISFCKILRMIALAMFFTLLINLPMLYPIFKTVFFVPKTEAIAAQGYVRSFNYLFSQSARPLSYLLPAAAHPIFGRLTKSMFGSIFYGRGSIEQTLYLGWVPIILAYIAYKNWRKRRREAKGQSPTGTVPKEDFYIGFFIFSAILAFLFSLPPYLNLGIFKIYFPSFFMYKILPMFRAYARFGIVVMLCVSVLAGFGLKYILERIRTSKKKFAFATLITCLVLFEFTNIPPFHVTDISKPPEVYQWLAKQPGDFAIAEYPLGETVGPGEASTPLDYLFYQRVHQKKIINGAQIGTYAYKVKQKINKIMDTQTPGILKWLRAKYVVIHLDRYKTSGDSDAADILGEVPDLSKQKGLKFVRKFDEVEVYEVVAQPIEPKVD